MEDESKNVEADPKEAIPETDLYGQKEEPKYFQCANCLLKEIYEYYGKEPPFYKKYKLLEDAYVIEDPYEPPKLGEILILGSHCVKCDKSVCKDAQCSFYYDGTYCIQCAKNNEKSFPKSIQLKLNKIVLQDI